MTVKLFPFIALFKIHAWIVSLSNANFEFPALSCPNRAMLEQQRPFVFLRGNPEACLFSFNIRRSTLVFLVGEEQVILQDWKHQESVFPLPQSYQNSSTCLFHSKRQKKDEENQQGENVQPLKFQYSPGRVG